MQTATTETNSRAAAARLRGYCLGGSFDWLEHVITILGWGFEALQRIELLICQFSCFNVQVGGTKTLVGDYVPRPGDPSSAMRWYLLDYLTCAAVIQPRRGSVRLEVKRRLAKRGLTSEPAARICVINTLSDSGLMRFRNPGACREGSFPDPVPLLGRPEG